MRKQKRRRGAKVTGGADLEGVEPRKDCIGTMVINGLAGHSSLRAKASAESHPPAVGPRPYRASHRDYVVTKEIRQSALLRRTLGQV